MVLAVSALGAAAWGAVLPVKAAWGDGLPVPVEGNTNVVSALSGDSYYVSRAGQGQNTEVTRRVGSEKVDSTRIPGDFSIPAVAIDGTASGLSADESTLILIAPRQRFPQQTTRMVILDAGTLELRDTVILRGDFSFDAISPDGSLLYFIHYTSPRDPTDYEVRAFDTAAGKLVREPIVDPDEPDEQMGGYPFRRVMSPDGRWAYTLYDGAGGTPFIHALDTTGQTAQCIDLDGLSPAHLDLQLADDGGTLIVSNRGRPTRVVDTETFAVTEPEATASPTSGGDAGDGADWLLVAIVVAGAVVAASLAVRHYRRPAST